MYINVSDLLVDTLANTSRCLYLATLVMKSWEKKLFFNTDMFVQRLQMYKQAVADKTGGLVNEIALFIDGTKQFICRPGKRPNARRGENLQKACYSGHKRRHCLSFQGCIAPDGIYISFFGPVEGRRHDSTLLRMSGLLPFIRNSDELAAQQFLIYGEPAYAVNDLMCAPFKGATLSPQQAEFNRTLSKARVSVEWGFGNVKRLFAFVEYAKSQKILLSPIATLFKVAVLLTNIHVCITERSQSSVYFHVQPPTLEEYLN